MANRDDARARDATGVAGEGRSGWEFETDRDWRALGDGRYAVWVGMPWGVEVPALVLVTSAFGWARRPESRDPRWTAYAIGPAVVGVRLLGGVRAGDAEVEPARGEAGAGFDPGGPDEGESGDCRALQVSTLPAA